MNRGSNTKTIRRNKAPQPEENNFLKNPKVPLSHISTSDIRYNFRKF